MVTQGIRLSGCSRDAWSEVEKAIGYRNPTILGVEGINYQLLEMLRLPIALERTLTTLLNYPSTPSFALRWKLGLRHPRPILLIWSLHNKKLLNVWGCAQRPRAQATKQFCDGKYWQPIVPNSTLATYPLFEVLVLDCHDNCCRWYAGTHAYSSLCQPASPRLH